MAKQLAAELILAERCGLQMIKQRWIPNSESRVMPQMPEIKHQSKLSDIMQSKQNKESHPTSVKVQYKYVYSKRDAYVLTTPFPLN